MTPLLCNLGAGGGASSKPAKAAGLLGPSLISRSATSGKIVSMAMRELRFNDKVLSRFEMAARPSLCMLSKNAVVLLFKV